MPNNYDRYTIAANQHLNGGYGDKIQSRIEQQVAIIHALLSDGEWHTAQAIADRLQLSKRHTQNIMQALVKPFAIASGQQGYCIPQKHTILIA
jgi:hypothetical protein